MDQNLSSRIRDLEAAVEYYEPEEIVLFGTSFGGKVVLHSAVDMEVAKVVTKAPVTYNETMDKFREVVKNKGRFEYIDGKPINQRFFDDLESNPFSRVEERIDSEIMIFHGADDSTVKPRQSFRAARRMDTDVSLRKLQGEKHSFTAEAKERMIREMFDFVERI